MNFEIINNDHKLIKAWIRGVQLEDTARQQLLNISSLPFIYKWLAVMPDAHLGKGACVGSVIPTLGAVIPASVGVDLGCGIHAIRTNLTSTDIPENTRHIREVVEQAIPHGRTNNGGDGDRGAWGTVPDNVAQVWNGVKDDLDKIVQKHPRINARKYRVKTAEHLGSLGTGNHFWEMCLDEKDRVWIMLHSGSRGIGNRIGSYFIELAQRDMEKWFISWLPDKDLSYFPEGTEHFDDYVGAVGWAQNFARLNRQVMLQNSLVALKTIFPQLQVSQDQAISCHHNYISRENHYGKNIWVTRKGAVSAREGQLGIIPGSMGTRSYIVRGKGNRDSFTSCSHGAGRVMSRTEARKKITLEDHIRATEGVECRKDNSVLDESPAAYKNIDQVMAAQSDLVEPLHVLKQFLCIKG